MLRLEGKGPHLQILSTLCAECPHSPAGCCVAPPRLDWSDVGRVVALGGRDWLLAEIAAGRLRPVERGLVIRRRKAVPREGGPKVATCAYHGPAGCTIPADRRAATCNYYVCEDALQKGGPAEAEARVAHDALVARFSAWDEELHAEVRARYPEGPSWDEVFLGWLGDAYRARAPETR